MLDFNKRQSILQKAMAVRQLKSDGMLERTDYKASTGRVLPMYVGIFEDMHKMGEELDKKKPTIRASQSNTLLKTCPTER